jgi:hypothetical protein
MSEERVAHAYVVGTMLINNDTPYDFAMVDVMGYDLVEALQAANIMIFGQQPPGTTLRAIYAGPLVAGAHARIRELAAQYLLRNIPSKTTA